MRWSFCFIMLSLVSGCTPDTKPVLESITPPAFEKGMTRILLSDSGQPAFVNYAILLETENTPYEIVKLELDIAYSEPGQRLYYLNESTRRMQFNNPVIACDTESIDFVDIGQRRYHLCFFDGYLNNQILAHSIHGYRWHATLRLRDGGQDLLDIESPMYLTHEHPLAERTPSQEDASASNWHRDAFIVSPGL